MLMKHNLLIFSCLLLSCLSLRAQVYEVPFNLSMGSIVRWWSDSTVLVYIDSLGESSGFLLYTQGQPVAQFADIPSSVVVHDLRIEGDEAYFCGTKLGVAMTGCFNIPSLFFGGVPIHYTSFMADAFLTYVDFKRLEVFPFLGLNYLALVGETMMGPIPNTTVASVVFTGTGWYRWNLYNKDTVVRYTDITCLDDMVVAVGTRADHQGCCIRTFLKTMNFPSNPFVVPTAATVVISGDPAVEKVFARQLTMNRMALAYHSGKPNTWLHDITFSSITGLPVTTPSSFFFSPTSGYPYTAGWNLRELACRRGMLFLQEDAAHLGSGMQSWLLEWDPTLVMPQFICWSFLPTWLHSSDVEGIGDRPITSGETATTALELRGAINAPLSTPGRCNYAQLAIIKDSGIGLSSVEVIDDVLNGSAFDNLHYPNLRVIDVRPLCEK